jgi:hypothetical protein
MLGFNRPWSSFTEPSDRALSDRDVASRRNADGLRIAHGYATLHREISRSQNGTAAVPSAARQFYGCNTLRPRLFQHLQVSLAGPSLEGLCGTFAQPIASISASAAMTKIPIGVQTMTAPLDLPSHDNNRRARSGGAAATLTPEQEQFAEVLGGILAQLWRGEQKAKSPNQPDAGQAIPPNS